MRFRWSVVVDSLILLCVHLITLCTAHNGTLKLVQVVFRHGDRNPIDPFPNYQYKDESYWPEGFAQLTKRGKMQQYKMGQFLRDRYNGFLNASYSPYEIYVQSSNVDRTIMSAEANLAGLYPPNNNLSLWNPDIPWQPIPVHAEPMKGDNILRMNAECPKFDELNYDFLNNSAVIKKLKEDYKHIFELLTNKTGQPVRTPEEVDYVYDVLYIQHLYYGTWPDWAPEGSEVLEAMRYITAFSFKAITYTDEMQRLKGGPLLGELLDNFSKRQSGKLDERRKFFMYSAHDTTVAVLLNTMGVFDTQIPPYTSMVIMELWQGHDFNQTNFIKLFLRNETDRDPFVLTVPNCEEHCPLEKLNILMKRKIPVDWQRECQGLGSFYTSVGVGVGIVAMASLLCFALVVSSVCIGIFKKRGVSSAPPPYPYLHLQMEDEEA